MGKWLGYECSACGERRERDGDDGGAARGVVYDCPRCHGVLEVRMDLAAVAAATSPRQLRDDPDPSLWRYRALLPVGVPPTRSGPLEQVGGTPLYEVPRAARRLGCRRVWLKDDGRLPTGSLKDRASSVVVVRARELGVERVITASTGNAGVALAAMARAAGMAAVVLVPERAPAGKIAQLLVFGAELYLVRGSYDDAFALSVEAARALGWYCRNTGYNPFTAEGKKTVAYEICEGLSLAAAERATEPATVLAGAGDAPDGGSGSGPIAHGVPTERWRAPDRIFVSVGDGNIIAGLHKGLRELVALGWIPHMPKLVGVQAEGSAAIAHAYGAGTERIEPVKADTLADSIAADRPADGLRALRAATATGGCYVTVSDAEILAAIATLGEDACVFAEPAAAAAYAGALAFARSGALGPREEVCVLVTGNGLKDVAAATRATTTPPRVDPSLASLREAIAARRI
ncbi:MAG: pyridoxal-phosphate dependent enzyme [Polyangiaceae bacterium]|nr:pyridoxal-phosphate dependent enzyme [Polyangiaceae bacterium]